MKRLQLIDLMIILAIIMIIFLVFFRGQFVDMTETVAAAEKQGYAEIRITEVSRFFANFRGCGSNYVLAAEATAKNARHEKVGIVICAGWPSKAVTVRIR